MSRKHITGLTSEKAQLLQQGQLLPVMEMFYSIQGEGRHTGKAAAFLRIGGCDLGCYWCDVKESWDASLHPLLPLREIVDYAVGHASKAVVITGGEPLMANLQPLCDALHARGMRIYLETSGAFPLTGRFDWICLSPKRQMKPLGELLQKADELKVIVRESADLAWAETNAGAVGKHCLLYLQPEWSRYNEILPLIVAYVKAHPQWMISLQSQKFMQIP